MNFRLAALAAAMAGAFGFGVPVAHAGVVTIHNTLGSFTAAVVQATFTQNFDGIADGTPLSGVEVLPGISVTTNRNPLEAFASFGITTMFASGDRTLGDLAYSIQLSRPRAAFAFDIDSFEADPTDFSKAGGPGILTVTFADFTSQAFNVFGNLTGNPIFLGLVADTPITKIVWAEALEVGGGNEETSLDNFRIVPGPSSGALIALGLIAASWIRRRRG